MRLRRFANVSLTAAFFAGVVLARPDNTWSEQWFKAKFGHSSPTEQARITAEAENSAYRAAPAEQAAPAVTPWAEAWHQAKYGRFSPAEQNRRSAESANTAYRQDPTAVSDDDRTDWTRDFVKAKYGRDLQSR